MPLGSVGEREPGSRVQRGKIPLSASSLSRSPSPSLPPSFSLSLFLLPSAGVGSANRPGPRPPPPCLVGGRRPWGLWLGLFPTAFATCGGRLTVNPPALYSSPHPGLIPAHCGALALLQQGMRGVLNPSASWLRYLQPMSKLVSQDSSSEQKLSERKLDFCRKFPPQSKDFQEENVTGPPICYGAIWRSVKDRLNSPNSFSEVSLLSLSSPSPSLSTPVLVKTDKC